MGSVEYRVAAKDRETFLSALDSVAAERRRDGAYRWGVFQVTAEEARWIEIFLVDSWVEHLRQHERGSNGDRQREYALRRFLIGETPTITHYIAPAARTTFVPPKN